MIALYTSLGTDIWNLTMGKSTDHNAHGGEAERDDQGIIEMQYTSSIYEEIDGKANICLAWVET